MILNNKDQIATALRPLSAGESACLKIEGGYSEIAIKEDIPICHKFAVEYIRSGDVIHKYGESIGIASEDIDSGAHVHIHNLKSLRAVQDN